MRKPNAMFSPTVIVGNSAYDWKTMPRPRLRGDTPLTTRPSKRMSPLSGVSKPAIIRSVVVLPQPEPPTSETSSPGRMSNDSPSTAVAPAKRLRTSRSTMFIEASARELLQPLLDEPVLLLGRPHAVERDELQVGDLGARHRNVGARDSAAPPLHVGVHGRARHRPVEEPPPVLRSEEHTSELQSHSDLVCRLLLEKKNYART